MKKLIMISATALLMVACGDPNAHKTVEWYMEHQDVMKEDVKKCETISLKNRENWCEAAEQAERKKMLDEAKKLEAKHEAEREAQYKKILEDFKKRYKTKEVKK